ncbi:methyltransferase family protein [Azomonas agilis]|uniref:Methyltransferase family protein n=1 Tax=Azomonas agilis TaxID=116849 RepID=A0A562J095_9GAMM|nr:class I SAM-dependent methyltransferase [Azomonas agilis]TWH76699.1 methyltransferase family protein [Azomonas agilis]
MQKHTLQSICKEHNGLISDKWNIYLSKYEHIFFPKKQVAINLLEIGVQNGGSLEIWEKYFPNADKILGCDINSDCGKIKFDTPKVHLVIGDITNSKTLEELLSIAPSFDIIIDDGSHTSNDIVKTFCTLFPHLKSGGIFIAEDLHCSYWKNYQGGLFYKKSSISFFKALVDILNFEHWGLKYTRRQLLADFDIPDTLDESILSEIHSIEFINSMCIITRQKRELNELGKRHVVGKTELVYPVKQLDGTYSKTPPQKLKSSLFQRIKESLKIPNKAK